MNFAWTRNSYRNITHALLIGTLSAFSVAACAQEADEVRVVIKSVAKGIDMLTGRGGNIALAYGERTFVVDDQYAEHASKVQAAMRTVVDREPDFVLNTHWHGDHTGGNEAFASRGALIFAHENVRKRMSVDQVMAFFNNTVEASPPAALPVVTFTKDMSFHINGQQVTVIHVPAAHTDGDAIVHFEGSNVVHTGDVVFNGMYPFIDYDSGGSIRGMVAAVDRILSLCDDSTQIIPGHGMLASADDLRAYRGMLEAVRSAITSAVADGKSVEQVQAMAPTKTYDADWGGGFISPERFVAMVYRGIIEFEGVRR